MSVDQSQMTVLAIVLVLIAAMAIAAWVHHQRTQSHRLKDRFGNEYYRMLEQTGSAGKAEAELKARERRVEKMKLIALPPEDAQRFTGDWKALQARFVDNPQGAVAEADRLVRELMARRGYPMGDFERQAADISVDHPQVVENYRAAHDVAVRIGRGGVDTEALRRAVVHYRALFDELLEVDATPRQ